MFGRPADPLGLAFFNEATSNGADLTAIGDLAATAEYQSRFEGMTDVQIVNSIYQSLFGRDAELPGLTFFVNALTTGAQNINTIAINIYDGAQSEDLETLQNKEAAANLFTESLDTGAEVAAYVGEAAAAQGRAYLAGVTADPDTIPPQAAVDAMIAAIVAGTGTPGETFTLTSAIGENIVGTANDDIFTAVLDGRAANSTLNIGDTVDGAGGRDTFNITVSSNASIPTGATIRNIEVINIVSAGGIVPGLESTSFQGVQEIWQVNASTALTVGQGVTAGFRDTAIATIVTAAANVESLSIALDNVTAGSSITLAGADLKSVSVSGSVVANGVFAGLALETNPAITDIISLDLALTSTDVPLAVSTLTDLERIDASASTGNIGTAFLFTVLGGLDNLVTYVGSQGNDFITVDLDAGVDRVIDLGAGNDRIGVNGTRDADGNLTITLGAGVDRVDIVTALTNIAPPGTETDFLDGLISITDFNGAEDVLGVAALGPRDILTNDEVAVIQDEETLFDALVVANGFIPLNSYGTFVFNGSTYLLNSVGGAGIGGDGLLELAGFTGELTAQNFIAR